MNAEHFMGEAGHREVELAVKAAEQQTSAEFACVVATESGRYDRAEAVLGLLLALVGLAAADAGWTARLAPGAWAEPVPLWLQAVGVVCGFVLGNVLCTAVPAVRRLLVSGAEMHEEVERAATATFARLRVASTTGRAGVLIYVSLLEHRVVVLLDEGAQRAAPAGLAELLVAHAVERLRQGERAELLVRLVAQAAQALAPVLPAQPEGTNVLPDRVLVLHRR